MWVGVEAFPEADRSNAVTPADEVSLWINARDAAWRPARAKRRSHDEKQSEP